MFSEANKKIAAVFGSPENRHRYAGGESHGKPAVLKAGGSALTGGRPCALRGLIFNRTSGSWAHSAQLPPVASTAGRVNKLIDDNPGFAILTQ